MSSAAHDRGTPSGRAFPSVLRIPVTNALTGRTYFILRADALSPEEPLLTAISRICNEPEIYRWLFKDALAGNPYTPEKAAQWLTWSADGWTRGSHFLFAVIDEDGAFAAACDIKANEPVAETGYWSSGLHRGIMTNTLAAVCQLAAEAGFTGLYARTKPGNARSVAVLSRAGFVPSPRVEGDPLDRFIRLF